MIIFMILFIGIIDLGPGVFLFNGVSQAAREIARETSVHPGLPASAAAPSPAAMVPAQRAFVPELAVPSYACVDIAGVLQFDTCMPGDWVRVTSRPPFYPGHALPDDARPVHPQLGQQRGDPMTATTLAGAERPRGGQILALFALSLMVLIRITGLAVDAGGDLRPAPRPADRRRPGGPGRGQRLPDQQRRRPGRSRAPETVTAENGFDDGGRRHDRRRRRRHVQRRRASR